jgi:hypothetical protein
MPGSRRTAVQIPFRCKLWLFSEDRKAHKGFFNVPYSAVFEFMEQILNVRRTKMVSFHVKIYAEYVEIIDAETSIAALSSVTNRFPGMADRCIVRSVVESIEEK